MFVRSDWSLFRNLTTLGQKAGVPRERLARLVMKELVDNALDAGGEVTAGHGSGNTYYVEDNGPGIHGTDEEIASLFSFGRELTSSKLWRLPTRGALGNGLRVVAGAVFACGGKLYIRTDGRGMQLVPQFDGTTTVTDVHEHRGATGTRIEITFAGELANDTDVMNLARLSITLRGKSTYKGKTSILWYSAEDFFDLLQAYDGSLGKLLTNFDGTKDFEFDDINYTPNIGNGGSNTLFHALRKHCNPVSPTRLGLIGDMASDGYAKATGEFFLPTNSGEARPQLPYVVEVYAWAKDKDEDPTVQFAVNRTMVTAEARVYIEKADTTIFGCGIGHSIKTGRRPMTYLVNVQTPYMPITTDGKEPNLKPIVSPIMSCIQKAARRAQRATKSASGESTSKKDIIIGAIPAAIKKASDNGRYRFSLRQLFYAVRPIFQQETGGEEPDYNHFASVVTDYEARIGHDIDGIYRDARGTLYHPHTRDSIPLGTMNVEAYKRPEWTFNKVLYCEKEGFFPLLLDEKWPERHDCALLTSKGFASRAARDVIDLLGDSDEELLFFAIHDSDGPGTKILEALQEATTARPARRVRIIDLGLNPWEAVAMELQVEKVERKSGKVAVAQYVRDRGERWERWLQTQRVELNAMDSASFLTWLDEKMAKHSQGKVVPPADVLTAKLVESTLAKIRERLTDKILREAKIDEQVEIKYGETDLINGDRLRMEVEVALDKVPANLWTVPIEHAAEQQAANVVPNEKPAKKRGR